MNDDAPLPMPKPAPAFARHFTDPVYDNEGDDLAPFGSDEGWDLLFTWRERRDELMRAGSLATVLDCDPSAVREYHGPMVGIDGLDTSTFIVSGAFVLLRLTGRLEDADRALALEALDHLIAMLPKINPAITATPHELEVQRRDLEGWRNPD